VGLPSDFVSTDASWSGDRSLAIVSDELRVYQYVPCPEETVDLLTLRAGILLEDEATATVGTLTVRDSAKGTDLRHRNSALIPGSDPEPYGHGAGVQESVAAVGLRGPCCALVGASSAGHYGKMVRNGIECAVIQALAERYDIMRRALSLSAVETAEVLSSWRRRDLEGCFPEISEWSLCVIDLRTGTPLLDRLVDEAAQKGTGGWSSQSALVLGSPPSVIVALCSHAPSLRTGTTRRCKQTARVP